MPRPKQRTPELRDHVLDVALDLLARDGVPAFTARAVAGEARTSTPAVYELFGDKAGLVREVFFEGWRRLGAALRALPETGDPRADLEQLAAAYRAFVTEHRTLGEVMLSRPFSSFDPTEVEREAGGGVRELIVHRVRRCVDAGVLHGDPVDIAHGLVALVQGLAAAENAQRLGTSRESVDRRWELATSAMLDGLAVAGGR
jgi:AcrR family transcriptional regulator